MFTAKHAVLALGMLITGSFNTISMCLSDPSYEVDGALDRSPRGFDA